MIYPELIALGSALDALGDAIDNLSAITDPPNFCPQCESMLSIGGSKYGHCTQCEKRGE